MTSDLEKYMNSDSDMLGKYIEAYGKDVYSFCMYLTRDRNNADDLYQQTFLVAMENDEIDDDRNPKSYLISIAVNLWNNLKRKYSWRRKKVNIVYLNDDSQEEPAAGDNVEEQVVRRDEEEYVRRLVCELPDKLRAVVLMYYMEEMSLLEIAAALNIPSGTVKSRMHEAKNRLRERLNKNER